MRVKRGVAGRKRHKRMLEKAEGFRGRSKSCYKVAKTKVQKALQYAYRDRRVKKRVIRNTWAVRINAAVRPLGLTYSKFIFALRKASIQIDRKVLAEIAVSDPRAFAAVVEKARASL